MAVEPRGGFLVVLREAKDLAMVPPGNGGGGDSQMTAFSDRRTARSFASLRTTERERRREDAV